MMTGSALPQPEKPDINQTIDHLFRHEAGKMVAVLTRLFGLPNLEQAEDIVQDTMLKALESWKYGKIPDNPQAWLYYTAKNKVIDVIRRKQVKYKIDSELSYLLKSEYSLVPAVNELFTENEIRDSQLRMMFACCDSMFSKEAQIALILNTLCGLSVKEIADAFLTNEETIRKRLYRTKEKLRSEKILLDYPGVEAMPARMDAVMKTLYLLFNEGYHSSHPQKLIREDLCAEAMRLALLLTENPKTDLPYANALLALMCFQSSRFSARLDDQGLIILLKDQNRSQWNSLLIAKGNQYLFRASTGEMIHEFHIEAAIASIHANTEFYGDTDWKGILKLYNQLLEMTSNPVVALNRCLVIGETEGYQSAIVELEKMKGLEENCHYNVSLGEMYFKNGDQQKAKPYFEKARLLTNSEAEKKLIQGKINSCN
jgi:RNA polymerase sigma factor (sigma-70 family)